MRVVNTILPILISLLGLLLVQGCSNSADERAFLAAVEINELNIASLSIVAPRTTLEASSDSQFVAMAQLSTGEADIDVSDRVSWSSSDGGVFSVNSTGLVSAKAVDSTATLYVEWADLQASEVLQVSTAALQSIAFVNAPASLDVCANGIQLQVEGTFADNRTDDISDGVVWSSSTPTLATIDDDGIVDTFGSGIASVQAERSGISQALNLNIDDSIASVAVTPDVDVSLALGATQQFTATATYDDASTADITLTAQWLSDDETVLVFSSADDEAGEAGGLSVGSANISAVCNVTNPEASAAVLVAVTAPRVLSGIEIRHNGLSIDELDAKLIDSPLELTAFLKYSDGSDGAEVTVDDDTEWRVADFSGVSATVNNVKDDKGEVTLSGIGRTEIEVRYDTDQISALRDSIEIVVD